MLWRAWLLRMIVGSFCAAVALAGWFIYLHTNSEAIRQRVIFELENHLTGVNVEVGAAWLRPLGGISLRDVRLARRDDPNHPFLVVPEATIYHDKQQFAQGRMAIRKFEFQQPSMFIRRDAEGNWNLAGICKLQPREGLAPTVVVRKGMLRVEDRLRCSSGQVFEVNEINLTMVNDPLTIMTFQGEGRSILGPVSWQGSVQRDQNTSAAVFEFPDFNVNEKLMRELFPCCREMAEQLGECAGRGSARLELHYRPGDKCVLQPDLQVTIHDGYLRHPRVPMPLDALAFKLRYRDSRISIEQCTAQSGTTKIRLSLDAMVPATGVKLDDPQQLLNYMSLSIENFSLSAKDFERLPPDLQEINKSFKPCGLVSLTYELKRNGDFSSSLWIIKPEGMSAEYDGFPYPLENVYGIVEQRSNSLGANKVTWDLTGTASEQPIIFKGSMEGSSPNQDLDLHISGRGLPINETLLAAMGSYRHKVERFHPTGRGDFSATFRVRPGDMHTPFQIAIDFRDMTVRYDPFPYPLEEMSGTLRASIGRHSKLDFENFKGRHHGAEISIDGTVEIDPAAHVTDLTIRGAGVPFDGELVRAAACLQLQPVFHALEPRGRLSFTARLTDVDRAAAPNQPKPPSDLNIAMPQLHIDSILPDFMPYELTDVTASLSFAKNIVTLNEFSGQHGAARLRIGPSEIFVKPAGGVQARLRNVQLAPLIVDEDLLRALPAGLRSVMAGMEPTGPMSASATRVIVDTEAKQKRQPSRVSAQEPGGTARMSAAALPTGDDSPWIYWEDLSVKVAGASLKFGVRFETVFGEAASTGEYRHGQLRALEGNVDFSQAVLFRQPLHNIHSRLLVDPARAPGVMQFRDLKADLYGGNVVGQGRVTLGPNCRYDISLSAMQLRLEDIARQNRLGPEAQLTGRAMAKLYLEGRGADAATLHGGGSIDVPHGRIYNLPPLLDLLKFLKLHAPDGTAFEEAHLRFDIQGDRAHIHQFDLVGSLISLTGEGDVGLDGHNLRLDVYPVWMHLLRALPGSVRDSASAVNRSWYKVEMRGNIGGQVDYRQEILPIIVDPIRRFINRMSPPPPTSR